MLTQPGYRPLRHEDSSCGSVVMAALLEICCEEADMLMDLYAPKGWNGYTNVSHIRAVAEKKRIWMNKVKLGRDPPTKFNRPTAMFIQLEGPWERKGWRSAYSYTHWALGFETMVIDINGYSWFDDYDPTRPNWLENDVWRDVVIPCLCEGIEE